MKQLTMTATVTEDGVRLQMEGGEDLSAPEILECVAAIALQAEEILKDLVRQVPKDLIELLRDPEEMLDLLRQMEDE